MNTLKLYDLEIEYQDIKLKLPTELEFKVLIENAVDNILPANQSHYMGPWTQLSSPDFENGLYNYHFEKRIEWNKINQDYFPAIFVNNKPIGIMSMRRQLILDSKAENKLYFFRTGSWIINDYKSNGYGKKARIAILSFAFNYLNSLYATTEAVEDNIASNKITQSLGYQNNGYSYKFNRHDNKISKMNKYILLRENWNKNNIKVKGFENTKELFNI